jgi:hypothetical protein
MTITYNKAFERNSVHFETHILLPKICNLLAEDRGQMSNLIMDDKTHFHCKVSLINSTATNSLQNILPSERFKTCKI